MKCKDCNALHVGNALRQLNVRMKEHILSLKQIPNSSEDLWKLENMSSIALHSIKSGCNFNGAEIFKKIYILIE